MLLSPTGAGKGDSGSGAVYKNRISKVDMTHTIFCNNLNFILVKERKE